MDTTSHAFTFHPQPRDDMPAPADGDGPADDGRFARLLGGSEWLVISDAASGPAATQGVTRARQAGVRVDLLVLADAGPDAAAKPDAETDAAITTHALGRRHLLVVEADAEAALHRRVCALVPAIGAVPVAGADDAAQGVERALLDTPRCC